MAARSRLFGHSIHRDGVRHMDRDGNRQSDRVPPEDFDRLVEHLESTGWHGGSASREAYKRTGIPVTIHVSRVHINSGGYDSSGEYFGRGAPLYAMSDDHAIFNENVRAPNVAVARERFQAKFPKVNFRFTGARK